MNKPSNSLKCLPLTGNNQLPLGCINLAIASNCLWVVNNGKINKNLTRLHDLDVTMVCCWIISFASFFVIVDGFGAVNVQSVPILLNFGKLVSPLDNLSNRHRYLLFLILCCISCYPLLFNFNRRGAVQWGDWRDRALFLLLVLPDWVLKPFLLSFLSSPPTWVLYCCLAKGANDITRFTAYLLNLP